MKHFFLSIFVSLVFTSEAAALMCHEQNGVSLCFPKDQENIASALARKLPGMRQFLEEKGLKVSTPLHIIIDEELDLPQERVYMIPHREIRIPLRAPGVMEEGFMEPDPYAYFLFRGLCRQAMYVLRGGLPFAGSKIFGEIVVPNFVMPPWVEDGVCTLLFSLYSGQSTANPIDEAVFLISDPPDIARMSNFPGVWPGYFTYRIYGRPFMEWLFNTYNWDTILNFLTIHGRGVIPIEIDLKAKVAFGKTFPALWNDFIKSREAIPYDNGGLLITGYWPEPFIYWNFSEVVPGMQRDRFRGRYGCLDDENGQQTLWISEYRADGISGLTGFRDQVTLSFPLEHIWDPGPGGVAVIMEENVPKLILLPSDTAFFNQKKEVLKNARIIPPPAGALQLSGPVRNSTGGIAVAVNIGNNWDIWVYDGNWQRITNSPSIEMDPWWDKTGLVFASNLSGRFQIHAADMTQLTHDNHAAILPRAGSYLSLSGNGWERKPYETGIPGIPAGMDHPMEDSVPNTSLASKRYTPAKSIFPNYWRPDIYIGESDTQVGLVTRSRDVSGDYTTDIGVRYSTGIEYAIARLGIGIKETGVLFSRYPLFYDPCLKPEIAESRHEAKLFFASELNGLLNLRLSMNLLSFEPLDQDTTYIRLHYRTPPGTEPPYIQWKRDQEYWAAMEISKHHGDFFSWMTTEVSSEDRTSLYGGVTLLSGKTIYSVISLEAGHTWGDVIQGHGTFRIGGDTGEGYFTHRPSKLFPLRGFQFNVLEAHQAATARMEVFWPLANPQQGYKTLPLFLYRIRFGTFVDLGVCQDHLTTDDLLVGAGVELVTTMELAWGNTSNFRMGVAWPVKQPDYYPDGSEFNADDLDEKGPQFIVQLGMPL